jgi:E3 ubiquitin-protein ligase Mdm2
MTFTKQTRNWFIRDSLVDGVVIIVQVFFILRWINFRTIVTYVNLTCVTIVWGSQIPKVWNPTCISVGYSIFKTTCLFIPIVLLDQPQKLSIMQIVHCNLCLYLMFYFLATRLSKPSFNRSPPAVTEKGHPVTSPQEDLVDLNGSDPDEALCIICLMRPKNATIVHGTSGHVCCCLECANTLQRRNDPCPICREPIQLVIQQYLV